jgi:hypothetical protein
MGDNGKLYVSEELVEIYKKEVIPGADFLKPNQTECEYVSLSFLFSPFPLPPPSLLRSNMEQISNRNKN